MVLLEISSCGPSFDTKPRRNEPFTFLSWCPVFRDHCSFFPGPLSAGALRHGHMQPAHLGADRGHCYGGHRWTHQLHQPAARLCCDQRGHPPRRHYGGDHLQSITGLTGTGTTQNATVTGISVSATLPNAAASSLHYLGEGQWRVSGLPDGHYRLRLFDISGRELSQHRVTVSAALSEPFTSQGLSAGTYVVVFDGAVRAAHKIPVQR